MKLRPTLALAVVFLSSCGLAQAADLAGRWTADFDTQIGVQNYAFEFKVDGGKVTGRAEFKNSMGKGETELTDVKFDGNTVSFVEKMEFDGNELTITYTGTVSGDEMKLTRQVGDYATEQLVAKRAAPRGKPADAS